MPTLNEDVLLHITDNIISDHDYRSLYRCSLVDRAFSRVASRFLYRTVEFSPPHYAYAPQAEWPKCEQMPQRWKSALLPWNREYVLVVKVSGWLVHDPDPKSGPLFSDVLRDAISRWVNLHTLVLRPQSWPRGAFNHALILLARTGNLQHLTMNSSCWVDTPTSVLCYLRNLESLVIEDADELIVEVLQEWLRYLGPRLKCVRFNGGCTSLSAPLLQTLMSHNVQLRSLTIGYLMDAEPEPQTATYDDVFALLEHLPMLTELDIAYHPRIRHPQKKARLRSLRSLTIWHLITTIPPESRFLTWLFQLICASPLQELKINPLGPRNRPCNRLDGLTQHILTKHTSTLRVLQLPRVLLRLRELTELCKHCTSLEVLCVSISTATLARLDQIFPLCKRLQRLEIFVPDLQYKRVNYDTNLANGLLAVMPHLRQLAVQCRHFKVLRKVADEGIVRVAIEMDPKEFGDWEKEA